VRLLLDYFSPLTIGAGLFAFAVIGSAAIYYFANLESLVSWSAEFVPMAFVVVGIVLSVKKLREEHHFAAISLLVIVGVLGTIVLHLSRTHTEAVHAKEIGELRTRMDTVRDQNGQLLQAFLAKPVLSSQQAEMERRQNIQKVLRGEYILSHENVSPGLLAGTEFPPAEWMNKRLQDLGEKWKMADKPTPRAQPPIQIAQQPEKSYVEFSFLPVKISTWPIHEQTLPVVDGVVNVKLTFIPREHTAKGLRLWLRLCDGCSYKSEPARFQAVEGRDVPTERLLIAGDCLPNSAYSDISFSVNPPSLQTRGFTLGLFYGCDNCEPVNSDTPTILTVLFAR
jgi:hypothetical protein